MKITPLEINDILLIEPLINRDHRGDLFESFHLEKIQNLIKKDLNFVQDNESLSKQGVLHGLHYQVNRPQARLIRVSYGEIFDVAVDIRPKSKTFGKWVGEYLSAKNKKQIFIPEGFAHGFLIMSDKAQIQYKLTDYYIPEYQRTIKYNDVNINIKWPIITLEYPIGLTPTLSERDYNGIRLCEAQLD